MDENQDRRFLRETIRLACENVERGTGGPFGALVVKDGEVVARGTNRVTSANDPTAHAEVLAIREACRRLGSFELDGCTVYSSSEPCPMCLAALYWARPERVVFANELRSADRSGFDDGFIYEELEKAPEQRSIPFVRMEVEDAGDPFRLWDRKEDRVEY